MYLDAQEGAEEAESDGDDESYKPEEGGDSEDEDDDDIEDDIEDDDDDDEWNGGTPGPKWCSAILLNILKIGVVECSRLWIAQLEFRNRRLAIAVHARLCATLQRAICDPGAITLKMDKGARTWVVSVESMKMDVLVLAAKKK